jgi:hypothetical protein
MMDPLATGKNECDRAHEDELCRAHERLLYWRPVSVGPPCQSPGCHGDPHTPGALDRFPFALPPPQAYPRHLGAGAARKADGPPA